MINSVYTTYMSSRWFRCRCCASRLRFVDAVARRLQFVLTGLCTRDTPTLALFPGRLQFDAFHSHMDLLGPAHKRYVLVGALLQFADTSCCHTTHLRVSTFPLPNTSSAPPQTRTGQTFSTRHCLSLRFYQRLTKDDAFDCGTADPNWSNFLYEPGTRKIALIDFGATRTTLPLPRAPTASPLRVPPPFIDRSPPFCTAYRHAAQAVR